MIVSLRGTSGSGKTHVVRQIMKLYESREEVRSPGRRHPIGYKLRSSGSSPALFVPGHYEPSTPNGGVDTMKSIEDVYSMIWDAHDAGFNVLYEGKNMSDGVSRVRDMFGADQIVIVLIDHPVEDCVASVRSRGHKISEASIAKTDRKCRADAESFRQLGYDVRILPRVQALTFVSETLAI